VSNERSVHVYPNHVDAKKIERGQALLADTGERLANGERILWWHVSDRSFGKCSYCAEGNCEQRVESCAAWDGDIVIHDRPRAAH
jgi:hypothetical protein